MDLAEIKKFLKENKDEKDVVEWLASISSLNASKVKDFLTSDEDGKKLFNSMTDATVTKAVKTGVDTWKEKNLTIEVEKLFIERHPNETEADKRMRELTNRLDASEAKTKKETLRNEMLKILGQEKLSPKLLDLIIIGEDIEEVSTNITSLKEILDLEVQSEVKRRFKEDGRELKINDDATKKTSLEAWKLKNPFTKKHFNMTLQGKLYNENRDLYEALKKLAAS